MMLINFAKSLGGLSGPRGHCDGARYKGPYLLTWSNSILTTIGSFQIHQKSFLHHSSSWNPMELFSSSMKLLASKSKAMYLHILDAIG
jgi:hypothetical protein